MILQKTILIAILFALSFNSCVSIPKETVELSRVVGKDLVILHNSHRNMTQLYYSKLKNDINQFIDEVYTPFIIHYVLKKELEKYQNGDSSLYMSIHRAGEIGGKAETDEALQVMIEFQEAALNQIRSKRNELLQPIVIQETEIIREINQAYENAFYANSTITAYLESVQKVKASQKEALSIVGLKNMDAAISNKLVKASEVVNEAILKGKEIDLKSDEAAPKIEELLNKIKSITDQN